MNDNAKKDLKFLLDAITDLMDRTEGVFGGEIGEETAWQDLEHDIDLALCRARVPAPDFWQKMDVAPRDGTVFLAFQPHDSGGFQFACTCNLDGDWCCMMSGDVMVPTHWTTLPEPPPPEATRG